MEEIQYNPKVFISHSTGDDDSTRKITDKIFEALENNGYSPFLDRNLIKTGDEWRAVIAEGLTLSDAAILVLSEKALDSEYVHYEASTLRNRFDFLRNDGFKLLIVALENVTPEIVSRKMNALQLQEIQWVNSPSNIDSSQIIRQILNSLKPLKERVQFQSRFHKRLFDILGRCNPDRGLYAVADLLGIPRPHPGRYDLINKVSRGLIDMCMPRGEKRFEILESVVDELKGCVGDREELKAIINIVTPFCWVNPETAVKLPTVAMGKLKCMSVSWQRGWQLSEKMHIYQAYCTDKPIIVDMDDDWSGSDSKDLDRVMRRLGEKLCRFSITEESVKRNIEKCAKRGKHVFVVTPSIKSKKFLKSLLDTWKGVTFFQYDEYPSSGEAKSSRDSESISLEPPLNPIVEEDASAEWGRLMELAEKEKDKINSGGAFEL